MPNDNPFTLEIRLKQHTPLIHFQHDQVGATLRATELKPKLDRFLIEHAFKDESHQQYKIGGSTGQYDGLDYKIKILPIGKKPLREDKISEGQRDIPLFFGNLGAAYKDNPKGLKQYAGAHLEIFSFHTGLLEKIDQHIRPFFAHTNFGMRQSKGYGSFTVSGDYDFPAEFYRFTVGTDDDTIVFKTLDLFYKSLRGGINGAIPPTWDKGFTKSFYMKPMIFQYAQSKTIQWEKKTIKENFFSGKLSRQQSDQKNLDGIQKEDKPEWPLWHKRAKKEQRIVRDLLGLSTEQSWKGYGSGDGEKITKTHVDANGNEIEGDQAIARFKSPILFKPVKNDDGQSFTVYFRPEPIPAEYLGALFAIGKSSGHSFPLSIWENFDIHQFLRFAFHEVTVDSCMKYDSNHKAAKEIATTLNRIYREIRQNS